MDQGERIKQIEERLEGMQFFMKVALHSHEQREALLKQTGVTPRKLNFTTSIERGAYWNVVENTQPLFDDIRFLLGEVERLTKACEAIEGSFVGTWASEYSRLEYIGNIVKEALTPSTDTHREG